MASSSAMSFAKTWRACCAAARPETQPPAREYLAGGRSLRERASSVATLAHELQHEEEQVQEVEVERERAHDRLLAGDRAVIVRGIHLLDALRVIGSEAGEHQDANHGDCELQSGRGDRKR